MLARSWTPAAHQIDAALERSRSGQGAHVWIFFVEPVPSVDARKLGALLVTSAMERRPDIGFESYDRFVPSQDTQMAAPGADGYFSRIRNEEDRLFLADLSRPMSIRRDGKLVIADATIGVTTLGAVGVPSLFR